MKLALAPTPWTTYAWLAGLTLLMPLLALWLVHQFIALPLAVIVVVIFAGTLLAAGAVISVRACRLAIDGDHLRVVSGGLYRETIALRDLDLDNVRIHYPPQQLAGHLGRRHGGISYPGFYAGWFDTADDARALVVGTAPAPILRISTGDWELMATVANPQDVLTRLRAARARVSAK